MAPVPDPAMAAARLLAARRARDSLIAFTRLTLPDPADPDDAARSRYRPAAHHHTIAAALERVERGETRRLVICMPPRHGKSELASRHEIVLYDPQNDELHLPPQLK